jgi:hypothetical protein
LVTTCGVVKDILSKKIKPIDLIYSLILSGTSFIPADGGQAIMIESLDPILQTLETIVLPVTLFKECFS